MFFSGVSTLTNARAYARVLFIENPNARAHYIEGILATITEILSNAKQSNSIDATAKMGWI
ncbi:hypothetical protein AGMMS49992_25910 [Clostridia bacterium]|nr:hypothetical protein AGMMS49992_25910 [Clostridia bacterium]